MQSPRDFADARLARGEISAEQHASILHHIGPPPLPVNGPTSPPAIPNAAPKNSAWPWIGGGVLAVGALIVFAGLSSVSGLSLGNLKSENRLISFKLANSSADGGDVLLWVEQGNLTMCEHVTAILPQMTHDIRFSCPTLQPGQFKLIPQWASFDPAKAAVAIRIK
jgi:hypothetical protein